MHLISDRNRNSAVIVVNCQHFLLMKEWHVTIFIHLFLQLKSCLCNYYTFAIMETNNETTQLVMLLRNQEVKSVTVEQNSDLQRDSFIRDKC